MPIVEEYHTGTIPGICARDFRRTVTISPTRPYRHHPTIPRTIHKNKYIRLKNKYQICDENKNK